MTNIRNNSRALLQTGLAVAAIAFLHAVVAFYSWSFAPGNAAPGHESGFAAGIWEVTSFPVFWIIGDSGEWFLSMFILNGFIWAVVVVTIWKLVIRGRQRPVSLDPDI